MARITVEDVIDKVENRFELVLLASLRARKISNGAPSLIDSPDVNKDKDSIIALREIAADKVNVNELRESLKQNALYNSSITQLLEIKNNKQEEEEGERGQDPIISEKNSQNTKKRAKAEEAPSSLYEDEEQLNL